MASIETFIKIELPKALALELEKVKTAIVDITKRNDALAIERDALKEKVRSMEHDLAVCVSKGFVAQRELKDIKEKAEEYEKQLGISTE